MHALHNLFYYIYLCAEQYLHRVISIISYKFCVSILCVFQHGQKVRHTANYSGPNDCSLRIGTHYKSHFQKTEVFPFFRSEVSAAA